MTTPAGRVKVVAKITIAANPPLVFDYLTNLKYHFLWNPHLQSISPIKVLQEGDSYESASIIIGVKVSGKNKVTKLVPGQELQIENQTGIIHYSVNYRLKSTKRQTQLTCTTSVNTNYKPLYFAESIMKALAGRELQSDLQALKVAVEHKIR